MVSVRSFVLAPWQSNQLNIGRVYRSKPLAAWNDICSCSVHATNKFPSTISFFFYWHHWIRLGHFMRIENDCQYTWDRTSFFIFPEIRCCIVKLHMSFVLRTKQFELLLHISHAFFQMNTIVRYILIKKSAASQ